MTWKYYTNKAIRRKIDYLLADASRIMMYADHTPEGKREAITKEKAIIEEIAKLDIHFARRCGYDG